MEAPYVVVVQGPRQSGKTTLIKSLAKHYTKQRLTEVHGPVIVRANRKLRLCFYECPTDVNAMIDLGKAADLVLLLIDASVGFELETFEYLTILQNHGMPCVMGVLTHLDQFKENKVIRKAKKAMKKRFWSEVYDGAKLFYLSGLKHDLYASMDIHNLARFLSVLKWKAPEWRAKHSFMLADRFEYRRESQLASLYGYIRGSSCTERSFTVPGIGELTLEDIEELPDPVPVLELEEKKTHRTLKQKERILYAPSSSVGNLKYDHNTGYLNLPDQYVMHSNREVEAMTPGQKLVRALQDNKAELMQRLTDDIDILPEVKLKTQGKHEEPVRVTVHDLKEAAQKFEAVVQQEYLVDDTLATDLMTLVYGRKMQTGRDVMETDAFDIWRVRTKPRFSSAEGFVRIIKSRFMAGTAPDEVEELEEEKEEAPQAIVHAGVQPGKYVRLNLKGLSEDLFNKLSADLPILACGLQVNEQRLGFLKVRFLKHRWRAQVLKSKDPLVISLSWHRFQSLPLYCTEDVGSNRLRLVKYTPKHSHCIAVFYGPLVAVNTPFLAIQHLDAQQFRISASGIVLELDFNFPIMKKLKLVGEPFKIFKNTAFIKGMFNSDLEVTRFEGAKIKTVSGIRGMIKRPLTGAAGPPGSYRATFEDKIVNSDIVFLRSYYALQLEPYYNPIFDYQQQRLLKTTAQIRAARGLSAPDQQDSEYHEIVRTEKDWAPIRTPRKLEAELPFKSKPKRELPMERDPNEVKTLQSDRDTQIANFLRRLGTVKNQRLEHEKVKQQQRLEGIAKVKEREEKQREEKQRERIKRRHARSKN